MLSVGALIAGAAIAAPFIATGTFGNMYEALVTYTLQYVAEGGDTPAAKLMVIVKSPLYLLLLAGPWFVLGVLGAVQAARKNPGGHALFLNGFLAMSWLGIIAAGRFYDHYYVLLLPALALLLPLGVQLVAEGWQNRYARILIVGLLPLTFISPLFFAGTIYLQPNAEERHAAKYPGDYKTEWEIQGPDLAEWLKARTGPDDYIYNFGFASEIYFYSDLKSPTRFLFDHPFAFGRAYEERAIRELETNYPAYVIDTASLERRTELNYISPRISGWIDDNYDYVGRVYHADVYELKEGRGD
jgi:hypothetical protein